jgi:hypothetical protein
MTSKKCLVLKSLDTGEYKYEEVKYIPVFVIVPILAVFLGTIPIIQQQNAHAQNLTLSFSLRG